MNDRERLIELCNKKTSTMKFNNSDHWFDFNEKVSALANYLIANGVIVPPCKVGDMIYEINTKYPKAPYVNRYIVIAFHVTSGKNILGHKKPSHAVVGVDYLPSLSKRIYLEDFGKTVFLTKEEAEAELEKRGKENER